MLAEYLRGTCVYNTIMKITKPYLGYSCEVCAECGEPWVDYRSDVGVKVVHNLGLFCGHKLSWELYYFMPKKTKKKTKL